jgi:hypothetical protein
MGNLLSDSFFKIKVKQGHIYHFASVFDTSMKHDWGPLIYKL